MTKEELESSVSRLTTQNHAWIESERRKRVDKEVENCTFKPEITEKGKKVYEL